MGKVYDGIAPELAAWVEKQALFLWTQKRGAEGLAAYRQQKNACSIDGLPAFEPEDEPAA